METRDDLEKKVDRLGKEIASLRLGSAGSVRKRSEWCMGEIPLYEIALGPDPKHGEMCGHAKAIIAIGDIATGFLAVGGWARGVVAFGGLATGLLSFGGLSLGVLVAAGGLAIGSIAFGGGAVGAVAIGGAAAGQFACGGGAIGRHVISATRRDPEAEAFFAKHGFTALLPPGNRRRPR